MYNRVNVSRRVLMAGEKMLRESSRELIHDGIKKRKLESFEHIILNRAAESSIVLFLNHQYQDDYGATKNVSRDLLANLNGFKLIYPANFRYSTLMYDNDDSIRIWPRRSHEKIHIAYVLRNIEIVLPDGATAYVWSVFIPARISEGDVGYCILSYAKDNFHDIERFLTMVEQLSREAQVKEKSIMVFGGSSIRLRGEHHWDGLVLTNDIRQSIKDDLEFWIASEDLYRRKNIPYRKGYLFEGPPGNGKTAVARVILSAYDFAAYSFNFSNPKMNDEDLRDAFEEAATSAPSVFLMEDIDRIFTRTGMSHSNVTKEGLFNCLDGVATYSGLVVIATANNPEVLDKAIRHRPGRFDVPIRFGNPEYPQREEFLLRLLGDPNEHTVDLDTVQNVAAASKGMSMAFIKLVYETAAAKAFKNRKNIIISSSDIMDGLRQAMRYYSEMEAPIDRSAGFTPADRENPTEAKDGPNGDDHPNTSPLDDPVKIEPVSDIFPTTAPTDWK